MLVLQEVSWSPCSPRAAQARILIRIWTNQSHAWAQNSLTKPCPELAAHHAAGSGEKLLEMTTIIAVGDYGWLRAAPCPTQRQGAVADYGDRSAFPPIF
jgi:hypothetical protein